MVVTWAMVWRPRIKKAYSFLASNRRIMGFLRADAHPTSIWVPGDGGEPGKAIK
jgi:hypothetical protein